VSVESGLRTAVLPYLEPGEAIDAAFPALRSAPWKLFGVDGMYNFAVVATDRRIVVFRTTATRLSAVETVLFTLPRTHRFGTPGGALYARIRLGDTDAWVHRRYWNELHRSDTAH